MVETLSAKEYVDTAEKIILELKAGNSWDELTTTKIRGLLALTGIIYNKIQRQSDEENLSDDILASIEYLRVRFAYEAGREQAVRKFVEKARILEIIKEINGKRSNLLLFCNYMEALVAYHRYYDGKTI